MLSAKFSQSIRFTRKTNSNVYPKVKPLQVGLPNRCVSKPNFNKQLILGHPSTFHTSISRQNYEKPQTSESNPPNGQQKAESTEPKQANGQQKTETPVPDEKDKLIQQLGEQLAEAKKDLTYSLAERENIRRIRDADVARATDFGIQSFAKGLLDVSDNLSRCLQNLPKEIDQTTKILVEGVEMTEKELTKVFIKNGIEKFDPVGEKFDPNRMNAITQMADKEKENGSVGLVFKSGFSIKGRVLRPADVAVVKND